MYDLLPSPAAHTHRSRAHWSAGPSENWNAAGKNRGDATSFHLLQGLRNSQRIFNRERKIYNPACPFPVLTFLPPLHRNLWDQEVTQVCRGYAVSCKAPDNKLSCSGLFGFTVRNVSARHGCCSKQQKPTSWNQGQAVQTNTSLVLILESTLSDRSVVR